MKCLYVSIDLYINIDVCKHSLHTNIIIYSIYNIQVSVCIVLLLFISTFKMLLKVQNFHSHVTMRQLLFKYRSKLEYVLCGIE